MDKARVRHKEYQTKQDVIQYLAPLFAPDIARGVRVVDAYRTPGTFAHEYLTGSLTLEQIVETVKKNPNTCFCCMDERIKIEGGVTSHHGCGAAAIVSDLVQRDSEVRAKYERVVGRETTNRLLAVLKTAQGENLAYAKDAFGAEWSKAISRLAGVPDSYRHLEVDDEHHHYASMAVLDLSGNLMVNTSGDVGERAFFISNPKKVVSGVAREAAYSTLIDYGLLALQIARGAHSSLPHETPFTITLVRNGRVDEELWSRLWKEKTAKLEASWEQAQAAKPPGERVKLNYRTMTVHDTDLTGVSTR